MRRIWMYCVCLAFAALIAHPAFAQDQTPDFDVDHLIDTAFVDSVRAWLNVPVVRMTLDSRNASDSQITQDKIDALDKEWRKEREQEDQPLITSVLSHPLSAYLTRIQARSHGLYTEIFVMDKNGLNAGQSSITSDYWQGDEAKFKKTYEVGTGAVFIDQPEFNDENATWRQQLNLSLQSAAGELIGAATVEINLTELARLKAAPQK